MTSAPAGQHIEVQLTDRLVDRQVNGQTGDKEMILMNLPAYAVTTKTKRNSLHILNSIKLLLVPHSLDNYVLQLQTVSYMQTTEQGKQLP